MLHKAQADTSQSCQGLVKDLHAHAVRTARACTACPVCTTAAEGAVPHAGKGAGSSQGAAGGSKRLALPGGLWQEKVQAMCRVLRPGRFVAGKG